MTKEELRKSLDFVNEERERLQYDINNLTYQLAMKKAELEEANDSVTWWHNRFNAVQKELERKDNVIQIMEKYLELIIDLGYDYDGLSDDESLKNLINELVRYASLGRACNITETIYVNGDKKYNILHGELENAKNS